MLDKTSYDSTYMQNLKKKKKQPDTNQKHLQNGNRHTDLKNEFTVTRMKNEGEGIV